MQAGPGNGTAVNLHRLQDGNRSNLAGTGGRPLNARHTCLVQIVLKLIGDAVLVVVAGTPAALGIGDIVVGYNDTVNGYVVIFGILTQLLDAFFRLLLGELSPGGKVVAVSEAQWRQLLQLVGFVLQPVKALQHIKGHEGYTALPAVLRFEEPDRPGSQIAPILIGLAAAIQKDGLQCLEMAGADKRLAGDYQSPLIGNPGGNAADSTDIVGDILPLVPVAPGRSLQDDAALVDHF